MIKPVKITVTGIAALKFLAEGGGSGAIVRDGRLLVRGEYGPEGRVFLAQTWLRLVAANMIGYSIPGHLEVTAAGYQFLESCKKGGGR